MVSDRHFIESILMLMWVMYKGLHTVVVLLLVLLWVQVKMSFLKIFLITVMLLFVLVGERIVAVSVTIFNPASHLVTWMSQFRNEVVYVVLLFVCDAVLNTKFLQFFRRQLLWSRLLFFWFLFLCWLSCCLLRSFLLSLFSDSVDNWVVVDDNWHSSVVMDRLVMHSSVNWLVMYDSVVHGFMVDNSVHWRSCHTVVSLFNGVDHGIRLLKMQHIERTCGLFALSRNRAVDALNLLLKGNRCLRLVLVVCVVDRCVLIWVNGRCLVV